MLPGRFTVQSSHPRKRTFMRNARFPGASGGAGGGGSCLLSSGHPFEGQDCTPGSVALVGSSSFSFWCTLHQVAVLLSLSGVKTEAWAPTSFLISPTLCLLLILPHKAITETKLIMHCKYLNCKLFGSWESTAIKLQMAQCTLEP